MSTIRPNENEMVLIQSELRAPKNQHNSFGNFNYRSCEDILEALKPILKKYNAFLIISDEIVLVGARYYVKATASITMKDGGACWLSTAYARESEEKKGMDSAQITGAASSYARKYALNGLFAIDDTKDADSNHVDKVTDFAEPYHKMSEPSAAPKASAPVFGNGLISVPQQKRLFAISNEFGVPKEVVKAYMKEKYGIEHSEQITKGDMYNNICAFVSTYNKTE